MTDSIHSGEILCETCGDDAQFEIFSDCLHCTAAHIAHSPYAWSTNRDRHLTAPWLPALEREVERHKAALADSEFLRPEMSILDLVAGITAAAGRIEAETVTP